MKKITFFLFLTPLLIWGCSTNNVRFGRNAKYKLAPKEKEITPDYLTIKYYQSVFDRDTIHQIPINRVISGQNYVIYIGLAVFDTPQSIFEYLKNDTLLKPLKIDSLEIGKQKFYKLLQKKDSLEAYRLIFLNERTGATAVFTITGNKYLVENFYRDNTWIKDKIKLKYE